MKESSIYANVRREKAATAMNITTQEYRKHCDEKTAQKQGITLKEYYKQRTDNAAAQKQMSRKEYIKMCNENMARNKGFRSYKDYDRTNYHARKLGIPLQKYWDTLEKDDEGFYIPLPKYTRT